MRTFFVYFFFLNEGNRKIGVHVNVIPKGPKFLQYFLRNPTIRAAAESVQWTNFERVSTKLKNHVREILCRLCRYYGVAKKAISVSTNRWRYNFF